MILYSQLTVIKNHLMIHTGVMVNCDKESPYDSIVLTGC